MIVWLSAKLLADTNIFRKIFNWDFEGFARPERERIVETFSEGFLVEIFSVDFFKILQKIHTENPTENKQTHFDIWGRFAQNPYKKSN